MDYYLVPIELIYEPTDPEEVLETVYYFQDYFNETYQDIGIGIACTGVCRWDNGPPIATYLTIDAVDSGRTDLAKSLFQTAIIDLEMDQDLHLLSRSERISRVSE